MRSVRIMVKPRTLNVGFCYPQPRVCLRHLFFGLLAHSIKPQNLTSALETSYRVKTRRIILLVVRWPLAKDGVYNGIKHENLNSEYEA